MHGSIANVFIDPYVRHPYIIYTYIESTLADIHFEIAAGGK